MKKLLLLISLYMFSINAGKPSEEAFLEHELSIFRLQFYRLLLEQKLTKEKREAFLRQKLLKKKSKKGFKKTKNNTTSKSRSQRRRQAASLADKNKEKMLRAKLERMKKENNII